MEKHIIKIDKDTIPQMSYALALGKQQAGVDATDTSIQIVGDELHILGGIEEVYSAGILIGTTIGLLAKTYPLEESPSQPSDRQPHKGATQRRLGQRAAAGNKRKAK